jgi:hypothetical protein
VGTTAGALASALSMVAAATPRAPRTAGMTCLIVPPGSRGAGTRAGSLAEAAKRRRRNSLAYFAAAGHDAATIVTEVMLTRLSGAALMNNPLMMTVCPLWAGRLNSETPIRR